MYIRKEAVLSSQIEGTQSSLEDVVEAEARLLRPALMSDANEVLNYQAALSLGLERLGELPVSGRLIREIHARLMSGIRGGHRSPGEFRTGQVHLGADGADIHEATFVPPPPGHIAQCIADLETYLNRPEPDLPVLMMIGMAHAQFETIHPFFDGNGRLGRLLITFLLIERKVLERPVLYLSAYFKQHRQDYYEHLQRTRTDGDFEGWLKFYLRGVAAVATQAAAVASRVSQLREDTRRLIFQNAERGGGRAAELLDRLFETPIVTVNQVAKLLGVTYTGASNLVARLERLGVLHGNPRRHRNRDYRFAAYLELFRTD
jgi:Fic family protein